MSDVNVSSFRDRNDRFSNLFASEREPCYYKDIDELFKEFDTKNKSKKWHLFINSSKLSLKVILLHNCNNYPGLPMANSLHLKKTYETM